MKWAAKQIYNEVYEEMAFGYIYISEMEDLEKDLCNQEIFDFIVSFSMRHEVFYGMKMFLCQKQEYGFVSKHAGNKRQRGFCTLLLYTALTMPSSSH